MTRGAAALLYKHTGHLVGQHLANDTSPHVPLHGLKGTGEVLDRESWEAGTTVGKWEGCRGGGAPSQLLR